MDARTTKRVPISVEKQWQKRKGSVRTGSFTAFQTPQHKGKWKTFESLSVNQKEKKI